jgi:cell wall-associated NlpC family hydrolase
MPVSMNINVNVSTRVNGLGGVAEPAAPAFPVAPAQPGRVTPAALVDGFDSGGSVNQRVLDAANGYFGTSTRAGPGGGNVACAWAVNNVLARAGIPKLGANTNYVPSVEEALRSGRGTRVSAAEARPGDIVISPGQSHVGIYMGDGQVLSNSSSRASFRWQSGLNFDGYYGSGQSRIYRLNP